MSRLNPGYLTPEPILLATLQTEPLHRELQSQKSHVWGHHQGQVDSQRRKKDIRVQRERLWEPFFASSLLPFLLQPVKFHRHVPSSEVPDPPPCVSFSVSLHHNLHVRDYRPHFVEEASSHLLCEASLALRPWQIVPRHLGRYLNPLWIRNELRVLVWKCQLSGGTFNLYHSGTLKTSSGSLMGSPRQQYSDHRIWLHDPLSSSSTSHILIPHLLLSVSIHGSVHNSDAGMCSLALGVLWPDTWQLPERHKMELDLYWKITLTALKGLTCPSPDIFLALLWYTAPSTLSLTARQPLRISLTAQWFIHS